MNPVSRSVPNGKGYNRNKLKQRDRKCGRESYGNDTLPHIFYRMCYGLDLCGKLTTTR